MESRVAEGKASPKRDFRSLRGRNNRCLRSNRLEKIAQVNAGSVVSHIGEDRVVRMKILVRKTELKPMLELVRSGKGNTQRPSYSTTLTMEQRLNLPQRKHRLRADAGEEACRCSWTPALQSIPEEL